METEPTKYPAFWNEDWLKQAIDRLDTRKMTPEERFQYIRYTAMKAEAANAEEAKILAVKMEAVELGLQKGLPVELVAEINGVDKAAVREAQQRLGMQ